jgi:choline dehydrogenase-like flavoprotein
VDPVVLGAARADDDDRRADALGSRALDDAPAVALRQHQVEHAGIGCLIAESGETLLALRHPPRVESRGPEMVDHRLRHDRVVLDDQHLGHTGNHGSQADG